MEIYAVIWSGTSPMRDAVGYPDKERAKTLAAVANKLLPWWKKAFDTARWVVVTIEVKE